jgi:hypothetical protein
LRTAVSDTPHLFAIKSLTNWVWHHDIGAGVMQLVPKNQHTVGSTLWNTLHPNGIGGFAIWGK